MKKAFKGPAMQYEIGASTNAGAPSTNGGRPYEYFAAALLTTAPTWVFASAGLVPQWASTWSFALLVQVLAVAVVTDIRRRRIPNWATYPTFVLAFVLSGVQDGLPHDASSPSHWLGSFSSLTLSETAAGGFGMLFLMLLLISLTGGGGGDVKLVACLGALLGWQGALDAVLYAFIVGAAAIAVYALATGAMWTLARSLFQTLLSFLWPGRFMPPSGQAKQLLSTKVPLAPFFASGAVVSLVQKAWDLSFI